MAKTVEQLMREAELLREAKEGMDKERRKEASKKLKLLREAKEGMDKERRKEASKKLKETSKKLKTLRERIEQKAERIGRIEKGILRRTPKKSLREQKRVSAAALGIARGLGIAPDVRAAGGKVGRPTGPTGKYYIPGKGPVGVFEWRRYQAQLRRARRIKGQEIDPETFQELPPEQQREFMQRQMAIQQMRQRPEQQAQPIVRHQVGVQLASPISDNILHAPNLMRGEMVRQEDKPLIKLGQRPVTNPFGGEYLDIDPASGRPILKRRISERWLTGESL